MIGAVLLVPFLLLVLLLTSPVLLYSSLNAKRRERLFRSWLMKNEGCVFLIYTTGKRKQSFTADVLIPLVLSDMKKVVFDGKSYSGAIDNWTARKLKISTNVGFPKVGVLRGGQLELVSFKEEFVKAFREESPAVELAGQIDLVILGLTKD